MIILYWISLLLLGLPSIPYIKDKLQLSKITSRKLFHFLAVMIFAPVTILYCPVTFTANPLNAPVPAPPAPTPVIASAGGTHSTDRLAGEAVLLLGSGVAICLFLIVEFLRYACMSVCVCVYIYLPVVGSFRLHSLLANI